MHYAPLLSGPIMPAMLASLLLGAGILNFVFAFMTESVDWNCAFAGFLHGITVAAALGAPYFKTAKKAVQTILEAIGWGAAVKDFGGARQYCFGES